jgi:hypothetical protein
MYIQLLIFQLHTHRDVFNGSTEAADDGDAENEEEEPTIPMWMSLFGLGIVTLMVAWFSDALVGSIDEFCDETGVSRSFVGLIVLPIVGNAVEHITAVNVGEYFQSSSEAFCSAIRCSSHPFDDIPLFPNEYLSHEKQDGMLDSIINASIRSIHSFSPNFSLFRFFFPRICP